MSLTKPTEVTDWANSGSALKTATDSSRWNLGWQTLPSNLPTDTGERPNLNQQNYWQNAVHVWLEWAEQNFEDIFSPANLWTGASSQDRTILLQYLAPLQQKAANSEGRVGRTAIPTLTNNTIRGAVLSPFNNRMYFAPNRFDNESQYLEIGREQMVADAVTVTADCGYGCYHPILDRIYWGWKDGTYISYTQCDSNTFVEAAHGLTLTGSDPYGSLVWCPENERMYLIPEDDYANTVYYYIDAAGTIGSYTHGGTVAGSYEGACYSPTENRIYMAAAGAAAAGTSYNYIDCSDDTVGTITSPVDFLASAFRGATYSPTEDRIYFHPSGGGTVTQTTWLYLDCATSTLVDYAHGIGVVGGDQCDGAAYSPVTNRIYLPWTGEFGTEPVRVIDCDDGSVTALDIPAIAAGADIRGPCYSPTDGRIYGANAPNLNDFLYYIQETSVGADLQFAANPLWNKGL